MSEYQYYEFLALDRPLSPEDIAYVRTLSSRVQPTPSHAVFTYSWGSSRINPLDLLAKHYDMFLYLANWGSKQLAFRFPKTVIDQAMLQPYYFGVDEIELTAEPLEQWVSLLPETERTTFLVRAARGEPIAAELLRRLREVGDAPRPAPSTETRRTFAAIEEAAEEVRRQRIASEQRAAEQKRIAKLDALAEREEQVWASIPGLLAQPNANGYEQAVAHLAELRDLAAHRNRRAAFDARLAEVVAPYIGSAALVRRLKEKKLT